MIFCINNNHDFSVLHNSNSIGLGDIIISKADCLGYSMDLTRYLSDADRMKGFTAQIEHTLEVINYYPSNGEYLVKSNMNNEVARIKPIDHSKYFHNLSTSYTVSY